MSEITKDNERQDRKRNILLVIITLLLLLNGYFAFNSYNTKKKANYLETKRNELDSLYVVTLTELDKAQAAIDSLKGRSATLDSIISLKENQLAEKRAKIEELLQKSQLNVVELNSAKKMVNNFKQESQQFMQTISNLDIKVSQLNKEKDSLSNTIVSQTIINEKLLEEKNILNKKVTMGSLLKPENIVGIGIRLRNNSTELETNVAKKTQKLKLCFDIPENKITEKGEKVIYIKIIDPLGSTIYIENQGSGMFNEAETNEKINYTAVASFNYESKKKNICLYWSQNTSFTKGSYKVKFYQNNYYLTENSFELK